MAQHWCVHPCSTPCLSSHCPSAQLQPAGAPVSELAVLCMGAPLVPPVDSRQHSEVPRKVQAPGELPHVPSTVTLLHRYSEVKPLLKELDRLIEAALERILQPGNSSENLSPPLDLELWNQIPLVLIDEHDKDHPIILDIFETNQTAVDNETTVSYATAGYSQLPGDNGTMDNGTTAGNQTTAPPAPANTTSEEKKYKLAVKLVRGVPQWQWAEMRDGRLGKDAAGTSVSPPQQLPMATLPWGSALAVPGLALTVPSPSPCCRLSPGQSQGRGIPCRLPDTFPSSLGQASKMPGRGCGCCLIPFLLQSSVQRLKVVLQPLTPAPVEAPRTLPGQTSEAGEIPAFKNWPKIDIFY